MSTSCNLHYVTVCSLLGTPPTIRAFSKEQSLRYYQKISLSSKNIACRQTNISFLPTSLTVMRLYFAFTFQENIALTFTGNASAFRQQPSGYCWSPMTFINSRFGKKFKLLFHIKLDIHLRKWPSAWSLSSYIFNCMHLNKQNTKICKSTYHVELMCYI